ncbi:MAG: hypothetical protein K1W14_14480 [Muribaculaceae bacterium]
MSAGSENPGYITSACVLYGNSDKDSDWETLDYVTSNKKNKLHRKLQNPRSVRYLRLMVLQPSQTPEVVATRIYEFSVH